jgi:hypothetical protein
MGTLKAHAIFPRKVANGGLEEGVDPSFLHHVHIHIKRNGIVHTRAKVTSVPRQKIDMLWLYGTRVGLDTMNGEEFFGQVPFDSGFAAPVIHEKTVHVLGGIKAFLSVNTRRFARMSLSVNAGTAGIIFTRFIGRHPLAGSQAQ